MRMNHDTTSPSVVDFGPEDVALIHSACYELTAYLRKANILDNGRHVLFAQTLDTPSEDHANGSVPATKYLNLAKMFKNATEDDRNALISNALHFLKDLRKVEKISDACKAYCDVVGSTSSATTASLACLKQFRQSLQAVQRTSTPGDPRSLLFCALEVLDLIRFRRSNVASEPLKEFCVPYPEPINKPKDADEEYEFGWYLEYFLFNRPTGIYYHFLQCNTMIIGAFVYYWDDSKLSSNDILTGEESVRNVAQRVASQLDHTVRESEYNLHLREKNFLKRIAEATTNKRSWVQEYKQVEPAIREKYVRISDQGERLTLLQKLDNCFKNKNGFRTLIE